MLLHKKSAKKPRKPLHSPSKYYETLKYSMKKVIFKQYEAKLKKLDKEIPLNNPSLSYRRPNLRSRFANVKSPVSPIQDIKSETFYENSSEESLNFFPRASITESNELEQERTLESPLLLSIKKKFPDTIDFENEFQLKKKENNELKSEIEELQGKTLKYSCSMRYITSLSRELKRELNKEKESLARKFKKAFEKEKDKLKKRCQKELEMLKEELLGKIASKQKLAIRKIEQEMKSCFKSEVLALEESNEKKIKEAVNEVSSEYERQLSTLYSEIVWLRTQNDTLKKKLESNSTDFEILKKNPKTQNIISSELIDQSSDFEEILKEYTQLQKDYIDLKRKSSNALCIKCKAFTITNTETSEKIIRIRQYLDSA